MSDIVVVANGKRRTADAGRSIGDFLRKLDLAPAQAIVEYNGEPLERERFEKTELRSGDRIEIAQMVGGG
jgi:thiamine biosynthesis protein ThiS